MREVRKNMSVPVSRRAVLTAGGACALSSVADAASPHAVKPQLRIAGMLVDGVANPLGVHGRRHRLSWQLISDGKDVRQAAYRIGVASSREKALAGKFDLWDSGRIASSRSFDIAYEGKPPVSRQRAWWTVSVWTGTGIAATSDAAFWEMGLLDAADWTSSWVAAEDAAARADRMAGLYWLTAPPGGKKGGRTFRLPFRLRQPATVALFVAMNGKAELIVDNRPVALPPVSPNAWGPPQPAMAEMELPAGEHVAMLAIPSLLQPKGAILVRATETDGRVTYFNGRDGQTRAGLPRHWTASAMSEEGWEPVVSTANDRSPMPAGSAYLLRRPFHVEGAVAQARLYVTALGVYEAELNGTKVGDALLTPEFTDYRKTVLYAVHDVAAALRQGENVLGGIVGEGWYGSNIASEGRYSFGPAPLRYRAQLEIAYADGRRQVVAGDDRWAVARAPITASGIYNGEDYDARLEHRGWSEPEFIAETDVWQPAAIAPDAAPGCKLVGAVVPSIRRTRRLAPRAIRQIGPGRAVADFGQNFAGWVRLKTRGQPGQRLTLRFAELLKDDGSIDQSNLRGARAADTYILRGDPGGEAYEPRFTYHGFRYVEIEGLAAPLEAKDIEGIVVHSDLAETGVLALGSYVPQRLWQNGLWSQRSNFIGIPTDCPQRDERLGWTGDAHVFWDAAAYNMDVAAFTNRFMGDMADAQRAGGDYPDIAPDPTGGTFTGTGSSPGWADAGIILPWTTWWRYGDTGIAEQHWASMMRFMDSVRRGNPDLIWKHGRGNDYADWLALDAKQPGDATTPKDLVGTAMWKAAADAMAEMAAATGRTSEASAFRQLAQGLTRAFAHAFVKADGAIGNGSQTGYILALRFGLIPTTLRAAAARNLVSDIRRRGTLLSTGFLGTPYSLDVLADAGEHGLVYDLLLRTEFPSWGYMIAKNATTVWERWNGDAGDRSMNSFNHYALGAVSGFLWRRIAGIDATAPGFARFRFDPVYDPRLTKGGGRYESRSGLIETAWERGTESRFRLKIRVPANSIATVVLPTSSLRDVAANGKSLPSAAHLSRDGKGGKLSLELGSGVHDIRVNRAFLT